MALNVAEGSTGQSNPEFRRFLGYSIRSAIEVVACLHIDKMRNIVSQEEFSTRYEQSEEIVKMLQALRNAIK